MLDPVTTTCPYCGETIEVLVDYSAGDQEYIEDCYVCCRPINIGITMNDDSRPHVTVCSENE